MLACCGSIRFFFRRLGPFAQPGHHKASRDARASCCALPRCSGYRAWGCTGCRRVHASDTANPEQHAAIVALLARKREQRICNVHSELSIGRSRASASAAASSRLEISSTSGSYGSAIEASACALVSARCRDAGDGICGAVGQTKRSQPDALMARCAIDDLAVIPSAHAAAYHLLGALLTSRL